MQLMYALLIALAAGCGSKDKCEQATDKLEPMLKAQKDYDRAKSLEDCRKDLAANPNRERLLDCVLSLPDPVTGTELIRCANTDKFGGKK